MTVRLRPPTLAECQLVRLWRNAPDVLPGLRTGYKTAAEQELFYREIILNPHADHRYYAIEVDGAFCGLGGLTYLSRVQYEAEISLLLGPEARGKGIGSAAVDQLLGAAWTLGLESVVGICYRQGAVGFWKKQVPREDCISQSWWNRIDVTNHLDTTPQLIDVAFRWRWTRKDAA